MIIEFLENNSDILMFIYGLGIVSIGFAIYISYKNLILIKDFERNKNIEETNLEEWLEWDISGDDIKKIMENGKYYFHKCNMCGKGINGIMYCFMDEMYCSEKCRKKMIDKYLN